MSASKFLFKSLLKPSKRAKETGGFTLIELLVAMILAVLVITPLLTLVLNLLDTDRQEQAKTSSQQEIQAALDYIALDMKQAVYVYDATALKQNSGSTPSGIKDQIPPTAPAGTGDCDATNTTYCVPVLAFWKRKFLSNTDTVKDDSDKEVDIGKIADSIQGSDRFLYSLVVYYLIKDKDTTKSTWSPAARIGRFEITDGIPDPLKKGSDLLSRSYGFAQPFATTPASTPIQQRMNAWKKDQNKAFIQTVVTLIDYIDDTTLDNFPPSVKTPLPSQFVLPQNDLTDKNGTISSKECSGADRTGKGVEDAITSSRVPPDEIIPQPQLNTASFYGCVNPVNALGQSVAQLYLRGNALARLSKDSNTWTPVNDSNKDKQLSYRPTASIRVAVRGLLSDK